MKKSGLAQNDWDDVRNVDRPNDFPFVSPRILGEYAKLDSRQKNRVPRRKLRRKLEKSTEIHTFYLFPDNGLALF